MQAGPETGPSRLLSFSLAAPHWGAACSMSPFCLSGALGRGKSTGSRRSTCSTARPTGQWMAPSVKKEAMDREETAESSSLIERPRWPSFLKSLGPLPTPSLKRSYRLPNGDIGLGPRDAAARTGTRGPTIAYAELDDDTVDAIFEANLSTDSGYLFQHRLTAPVGLSIQSISRSPSNAISRLRTSTGPSARC